jgi:hypothetical protein
MANALEAPNECISLTRAAELSGRSSKTLSDQAIHGRLRTVKIGLNRRPTRRWLHAYLEQAQANAKARFRPLPEGYVPPE